MYQPKNLYEEMYIQTIYQMMNSDWMKQITTDYDGNLKDILINNMNEVLTHSKIYNTNTLNLELLNVQIDCEEYCMLEDPELIGLYSICAYEYELDDEYDKYYKFAKHFTELFYNIVSDFSDRDDLTRFTNPMVTLVNHLLVRNLHLYKKDKDEALLTFKGLYDLVRFNETTLRDFSYHEGHDTNREKGIVVIHCNAFEDTW